MPLDDVDGVYGTFIPFVDWSEIFVNDPLPYESDHSLLGAGIGLDLRFASGLRARLDFAKPLREISNGGTILDGTRSGDHRVHALTKWDFNEDNEAEILYSHLVRLFYLHIQFILSGPARGR